MKFLASNLQVFGPGGHVATAASVRLAKRIANALNYYRPKVRRRKKSAEKAVDSRP